MNFTDLCNEVITLTNRPDLVNETQLAVRAGTLRAHHTDFYYKDLVEQSLQFSVSQFWQHIQLSTFPNFRALKYLRKYFPGITAANYAPNNLPPLYGFYSEGGNLPDGRFFDVITPEEVLDGYGANRVDVAYIAGQQINCRSGDNFQYLLCGYYQNPNLIPATYSSWIANEFPYAIIYAAAAIIFKTIGYDEQNAAYQNLMSEEITMLRMSNLVAVGS